MEIGWNPKSESLRHIAERLSIGLEHMVFVDDNPVECEEVRLALPQVHVIALPGSPSATCAPAARRAVRHRHDVRRGPTPRRAVPAACRSRICPGKRRIGRGFLSRPCNADRRGADGQPSLPRAAQLTQKTNQFNVTTRRYTEAEIGERLRDPSWVDSPWRSRIVSVTTVSSVSRWPASTGPRAIDTLLMSCRVIGRTVETAMLAHLCDEATARGLASLRGRFVPTPKNAPARDCFERHGFVHEAERDGGDDWCLDLSTHRVEWPTWFLRRREGAVA